MFFSVLGTVAIRFGDRLIEVQGRFQRIVLLLLLLSRQQVVLADTLIDELWGEEVPKRAENALQAHVSRLRRRLVELEPDRLVPRLARLPRQSNRPSGYRLLLSGDEFDGSVFLDTIREVRRSPAPAPSEATRKLRAALSLWTGPPFGGLQGGPICQAAAARFHESRLVALDLLFENELRQGRHCEVIPELSEQVECGSLNERLCERLMVALYRAGRQTDALATYRRMRSRLNNELGIEPSPLLQRCERAILSHDPALQIWPDGAGPRLENAAHADGLPPAVPALP